MLDVIQKGNRVDGNSKDSFVTTRFPQKDNFNADVTFLHGTFLIMNRLLYKIMVTGLTLEDLPLLTSI